MGEKNNNLKLFAPGHNACPGCGVAIGTNLVMRAAGKNNIVCTPTGCLETFSATLNSSAWEVPWIHPLFENAPSVASGIEAALDYLGKNDVGVIVIGGDGATYDIGFGALSGMLERKHNILYVCTDNEAYMNTGIQRSGATPFGASTTTTPAGKYSIGEFQNKKNMIEIVNAHEVDYVASASIAYPRDLMKKVKKGLFVKGPAYIHLITPCHLGWGISPEKTVEISRLIVKTALFPLLEFEKGRLNRARRFKDILPVSEYLNKQKRFSHLSEDEHTEIIDSYQKLADENIEKYGLITG